jgi:hypothetical protein
MQDDVTELVWEIIRKRRLFVQIINKTCKLAIKQSSAELAQKYFNE